MSTQRVEVIIVGDMEKSGPLTMEEGQGVEEALIDLLGNKTYSYRINGETVNGEEQPQPGDRVTAVPEDFKVKAGA